ncbi:hypothetical protein T261_7903 [Streptomyces lydicus]|nr:hypothetical protein T261_7903 [Streptomyces lydicus]
MLAERAAAGVRVRLCFGDPGGQAVVVRGREEGIGDTLAAKIRASLFPRGLRACHNHYDCTTAREVGMHSGPN